MLSFPAMYTMICENKCVICPICREPEHIPYKTLIDLLDQRDNIIIALSYHVLNLSHQLLHDRNVNDDAAAATAAAAAAEEDISPEVRTVE